MGLHGLKNKTSRNSFDLSHRNLFTAKVGELLPCFVQEVNPGDSIKLDSSYFTRTAPLQTAAFTRLRENVQYFFVPYQCLWKYFEGQVKNMTKNANGGEISLIAESPFINSQVSTQMPYISYLSLHKYLNRLLVQINGTNLDESHHPELFVNGCFRHAESAKLLQLLGYGNFTQQFEKFHTTDDWVAPNSTGPALSVFRLLAYQKICNDFYTYRQWQPYNASLCNIDYISPNDQPSFDLSDSFDNVSDINLKRTNMLDMRFSNLPLDYFNGVLPTPQFGSESVVSLSPDKDISTSNDINKWKLYIGDGVMPSGANVKTESVVPSVSLSWSNDKGQGSQIYHTHNIPSSAISVDLSVSALRNAFQLQKYKEIQLANDPDFESQIEAHFGIKPKHDMHKSRFIGGSSSMIDINPVVNQNLGSGNLMDNQAVTKAAPTGQGGSSFKFTADTFGVVIGIYRCTPVLDYAHVGIDRTLLKTDASDFVIPEFDSIGMQQTFCCEVYAQPSSKRDLNQPVIDMTQSFGYAPRYSEYKVSYDRFNGAFCDTLKSWVTGMSETALVSSFKEHGLGSYIDVPSLFVCRPDIVKSVFLLTDYHTSNDDNLYVGMVNMCYATRNLSRYGLPYSN